MVFFTCNHCGACIKKNQVEKHPWSGQCQKLISVSCHDCLKDFIGQDYNKHTKCITEAEKYSGKPLTPTLKSSKGDERQQSWNQIVHELHATQSGLTKVERNLLERIIKFDNIPRKRKPFQNFINNIFLHKMSGAAIDRVWDLLDGKWKNRMVSVSEIKTDNGLKVSKEILGHQSSNNSGSKEPDTQLTEENKMKRKKDRNHQWVENGSETLVVQKKKKIKEQSEENEPVDSVAGNNSSQKIDSTNEKHSMDSYFNILKSSIVEEVKDGDVRVCIKCGITE